ncbi:SLATT domain-containing protein [Hyalangium gracile]|uniref:SLATT domain-containing protein n=1 Tax=Hyalangium gracile TaxID=394092 RepID=UPI001CCC9AC4|nr:SLATT domain-containing protein [Hyalangium gracile]
MQPEQSEELLELYGKIVEKGREVMAWYSRQKDSMKLWGRRFRIAAILLGSAASITPIIVQLLPNEVGFQRWSVLASVFAVLGATSVGLDNYSGSSSGWMRYVSAYLELSARLEALQFGWARLALSSPGLSKEQRLAALLDLLQGFLTSVNEVVKQETQEWMAEFKGNLALLEQRMEAQRTALANTPSGAYGALKVQVEGAERLKDGQWKVTLETQREIVGSGSSAAVATGLGAGLLGLRLEATLVDGRPLLTEEVVAIRAGEITLHTFKVP